MRQWRLACVVACGVAISHAARADEAEGPLAIEAKGMRLTFGAWADAYVEHDTNNPANNTVGLRAFDIRSDSFALQMAALDFNFDTFREPDRTSGGALLHVTLQAGDEPDLYYRTFGSERASDAQPNYDTFRHLQQAYGGYKARLDDSNSLEVSGGIFISHIGFESLNAKDNFNYSRSLLFQLSPFYQTGVRAIWTSPKVTAQFNVTNGWNSVIDNNRAKSLGAQIVFTPTDRVSATLNWQGGAEQDSSLAFRNLFDAFVVLKPLDSLIFAANADVGFDRAAPGVVLDGTPATRETAVSWYGAAAYARVQLGSIFAVTERGEFFRDAQGAPWISGTRATLWEETTTLEAHAGSHVTLKLEARHDEATVPIYPTHEITAMGVPFVSRTQTSIALAGLIAF